jgi:hypothetical protein
MSTAFLIVIPYSLARARRFGENYLLCVQGRKLSRTRNWQKQVASYRNAWLSLKLHAVTTQRNAVFTVTAVKSHLAPEAQCYKPESRGFNSC